MSMCGDEGDLDEGEGSGWHLVGGEPGQDLSRGVEALRGNPDLGLDGLVLDLDLNLGGHVDEDEA